MCKEPERTIILTESKAREICELIEEAEDEFDNASQNVSLHDVDSNDLNRKATWAANLYSELTELITGEPDITKSKEQSPESSDRRTLNTVLWALRRLQQQRKPESEVERIGLPAAENLWGPMLKVNEIDALCERLNFGEATIHAPQRYVNQVVTLAVTLVTKEGDADRPPADALRAAFEKRMNDLDRHHEWHEAIDFSDRYFEDKDGRHIEPRERS